MVGAVAAVLLLPENCTPALNTVAALTVKVLLLLLPSIEFPLALSNPATLTALLAVMAAANAVVEAKLAAALTANVSLLLVPRVLLLLATKEPATFRLLAATTAAFNCAAALIVRVLDPVVPNIVLPLTVA